MLVLHGMYRFKPKRLAFRNDFCFTCEQPRRSIRIRTFDVWHVFWIPLVPLGWRHRWICSVCGHQPHVNKRTRRTFKWLGLFVLLIFAVAFWAMPVDPDIVAGTWVIRIGAPLGAILVLAHLLRTPRDRSLKERLLTIEPAADTVCPFCGTQLLISSSHWCCPACGVVRS